MFTFESDFLKENMIITLLSTYLRSSPMCDIDCFPRWKNSFHSAQHVLKFFSFGDLVVDLRGNILNARRSNIVSVRIMESGGGGVQVVNIHQKYRFSNQPVRN